MLPMGKDNARRTIVLLFASIRHNTISNTIKLDMIVIEEEYFS